MRVSWTWWYVAALLLPLCVHRVAYSQTQPLTLKLASLVFRHGDRSPVDAYPKDNYTESYWPQGFGQLSTTGMQQAYFLGSVLRHRYVAMDLIDSNYTRVQVYVRSTDYDRTLMTAEALLAALYPPKGTQVFHSSIPWQPIPIHTVPQTEDTLLLAYEVNCSRYTKLREEDRESAEYMMLDKENKEFFSRMEENTGQVPTNLSNVWSIQDSLLVQNLSGLGFPKWLEPEDWEKLTELSTYNLNVISSSAEKSRLAAGNWVGNVVGDMKTRKDDPQDQMRLYLYSAHDTTVANMATALGVYNGILPPYLATLIIELYSDNNDGYWVSLFYRNETDSDHLWPLSVDSCDNTTLCSLEEFSNHVAAVIPEDWEKECGSTGRASSSSEERVNNTNTATVALGTLLAVVVVLLLLTTLLLVCLVVRNTRRKYRANFIQMQESM